MLQMYQNYSAFTNVYLFRFERIPWEQQTRLLDSHLTIHAWHKCILFEYLGHG